MFRTAITSLTRQATKPQQIHRASTSIAAMALPKTQKAILQPDPQSTAVTMVTDHPVPTPKPSSNEHLVRVHTAAITNGELLWTKNFPSPRTPQSTPRSSSLVMTSPAPLSPPLHPRLSSRARRSMRAPATSVQGVPVSTRY